MQRPALQFTAWIRPLFFLALITLCGAGLAAAPTQDLSPRVAPRLLELAEAQPLTSVGVVVQKLTHDRAIEDQITRTGGTIIRDLPIINGFAAQVPAGSVRNLAQYTGIRWISLDSPVVKQLCGGQACIDLTKLASNYNRTIGATQVWNRDIPIRGDGVGVAVVDSGVNPQQDLYNQTNGKNRIVASVAYNQGYNQSIYDAYGHGNQVANIIGANGSTTGGAYVGVAPSVNLINVKVSDDLNQGVATTSSMVAGLQWIYDNRVKYNIRVVNISLTDSVVESYHISALAAAVEILWFNKIVVVVAAGNSGNNQIAAPANDPFVITVGASNDKGTSSLTDDVMASWSACGTTVDGFSKPDLVAPGVNLVAPLMMPNSFLALNYPANIATALTGMLTFRMSGTSVAAPVVAGVAALLLQSEPNLTPDQVKYRLMNTTRQLTNPTCSGAGVVNVQRAIDIATSQSANTGTPISHMLNDGSNPTTWNSTSWSTAKWSTAKWSTAKWSTAKWSTVMTP
jgi:serine protease AprX